MAKEIYGFRLGVDSIKVKRELLFLGCRFFEGRGDFLV
jgi:hypothetical protein